MGSRLIAMPKVEDANKIAAVIRNRGTLMDISTCTTAAEVLRIINDRDYGVVICTKSLKDMSYSELASYLPDYFGMILLTSDLSLEIYNDNMVKLELPFKPHDLMNTIELLTQNYYRRLKKKKKMPPQRSEKEKQLIDQAKSLLMERNGMTEPEAFKFIQKSSMDTGRSLTESAQMVLMLHANP